MFRWFSALLCAFWGVGKVRVMTVADQGAVLLFGYINLSDTRADLGACLTLNQVYLYDMGQGAKKATKKMQLVVS